MLKVGIIGCGAIGTVLAKALDRGEAGDARLVTLFDADRKNAESLRATLSHHVHVADGIGEILSEKLDLVIEAAAQEAVRQYGVKILSSGKSIIIMSVGALLDDELLSRLVSAAKGTNASIYVPSGAVLAVDALKAARVGRLKSVTLTTRKPPASLGVKGNLKAPKVIYSGGAAEAVRRFPQNVNVAATLSLAGLGKAETKVVVIADPKTKRNTHELSVEGDFGSFTARIENVPFPENPKTSYIAALSAVRLLRNLTDTLKVGT